MTNKNLDQFISKVQEKIQEIRSWPEYIDPSIDDEHFEIIETPFDEWYESRKSEFLLPQDEMKKIYDNLLRIVED